MARNFVTDGWARADLLDEVDSTNAFALAAAQEWHLVAAHDQRAGRGRLDRSWQVPPGAAVTMSMTLPLPAHPAAWGWVPLFVGDAVREALASFLTGGSESVATKWPNDVLVLDPDGEWRKVCGVLCQIVSAPRPLVVAGVGINVTQTREQLPVPTATSLVLAGVDATRDEVMRRVAHEVRASALAWSGTTADDAVGGGSAVDELVARTRRHCRTIGSEIEVHTPAGEVLHRRGHAIDDDGRLVTGEPGSRPGGGSTMVFSVADVVHARLAE